MRCEGACEKNGALASHMRAEPASHSPLPRSCLPIRMGRNWRCHRCERLHMIGSLLFTATSASTLISVSTKPAAGHDA